MNKFLSVLVIDSVKSQRSAWMGGDENQGASIDVLSVVREHLSAKKFSKNPAAMSLLEDIRVFDEANGEALKYAKPLTAAVQASIISKVTNFIKA